MGMRSRLGLDRLRARRQREDRAAPETASDPSAPSGTTSGDSATVAASGAIRDEPASNTDGKHATAERTGTPDRSPRRDGAGADPAVPRGIRIAAGWSWRLMVVAVAVLALGWVMRYLSQVSIALAVAILLTALMTPACSWLTRRGVPRTLAAALTMIFGLLLVTGTLTLIGTQVASETDRIVSSVTDGVSQLTRWLQNGPIPIPPEYLRFDELVNQLGDYLLQRSDAIAQNAATVGSQVGDFFAGFAIALFATFFFLHDGRTIWTFLLKLTPAGPRPRIDRAAASGWKALIQYVRATILVAFVDALGVFVVALILGVPLAPAIAALVFFLAFIPLIGAAISGAVAVLVTLVLVGWVQALIMLGGIILVMQLEGNLLQPLLLGRAVKLHPLAVLLGISVGLIIGGIVGALLSIPLLAFAKTFIQKLSDDAGQAVVEPPPARSG